MNSGGLKTAIIPMAIIVVSILTAVMVSSYTGTVPDKSRSANDYPYVVDHNYMGWKGTSSLLDTYSSYAGGGTYDFFYPPATCSGTYECILGDNTVVIVGQIIGVDHLTRVSDGKVIMNYTVRVIDILYKPHVKMPKYDSRNCDYIEVDNATKVCDIQMEIREKPLL